MFSTRAECPNIHPTVKGEGQGKGVALRLLGLWLGILGSEARKGVVLDHGWVPEHVRR